MGTGLGLWFKHARWVLLLVVVYGAGCRPANEAGEDRLQIVATTSMIADLVSVIGGTETRVTGLMGPGVDPHLYKASEGDVARMAEADLIFFNGLHLEGKMGEVLEQMGRFNIPSFAVAQAAVPRDSLIESPMFAGNFDPHVWFDVQLWMRVAEKVRDVLIEHDPDHAEVFRANTEAYLGELRGLHAYVHEQADRVPEEQRVLVTAHDAFAYFGKAYGFEVRGLQGLSTASEAGTADVQDLAEFITMRQIPAIFVETSVPPRSIEAVQAAVQSRGFDVRIGGNLFSDALGNPGSPEGTYIGTVRHNINTIGAALRGEHVAPH